MRLDDQLRARSGATGDRLSRLPREPARPWAVLACLDARMHLEEILGLAPGDANVLRNAGAVVTDDVIRSLVVSSHLLGTSEFAVIAHTGCGLLGLDEAAARSAISARAGADASRLPLHAFGDLHEHVREQVRRIASSPLLPAGAPVSGWIFDVADGTLTRSASATIGKTKG